MNNYGIPLDVRFTYGKLDWMFFTVGVDKDQFNAI